MVQQNAEDNYYSVDYSKINLLLVDCCQALIKENADLEARISKIEQLLSIV